MYPSHYAQAHPDRPAVIMAGSGAVQTYAELEARANQIAHALRSSGLNRLDHYAIFMENNAAYIEACAAGERAGLFYTCINSFLTAEEMAYIVTNSESRILITSAAKLPLVLDAMPACPKLEAVWVIDDPQAPVDLSVAEGLQNYEAVLGQFPSTPISDESLGTPMLYSSGTTGRPKGIIRPLPEQPPSEPLPLFSFLSQLWRYREDMIYLSPAPLPLARSPRLAPLPQSAAQSCPLPARCPAAQLFRIYATGCVLTGCAAGCVPAGCADG